MIDDISVRIKLASGRRPIREYWTTTDLIIFGTILLAFIGLWRYWSWRIRKINNIEHFFSERDRSGMRLLFIDVDKGEIDDFMEGDAFMSYLQAIPASQFPLKYPNSNDMSTYKTAFRNHIASSADISADDYKFLLGSILIADKHITEFCDRYDFPNMKATMMAQPWTIVVLRDSDPNNRIEKGMPFTIGRFIFLPHRFIRQSEPVDLDILTPNKHLPDTEQREQANLPYTLIHEKIHLIQRSYQSVFNDYYRRIWGSFISRREFPWRYRGEYFVNPDGLDINWTYGTFFPVLMSTPEGVREVYLDMSAPREEAIKSREDLLETIISIPDADRLHSGMSIYHPNEFFAYAVVENIKEKTSRLLFIRQVDDLFASISHYKDDI